MAAEHSPRRSLKLMAIGTLAGLFSGLFGVGGGSVIVPLLVLWLGYRERAATATSLAAIVFIAGFAAAVQGAYGNVRVLDALLIGVPAVVGVLLGTHLQQRLQQRSIALLFAAVLVASAVELVIR
ncbi:MAG TPA: sulfite exporter TauE/SafE family protein [Solirubrobacteraceae bacterium]|nr:sulfite exporter TauE/SafE family protein [Solirubrobacteraceae bacterium]